MGFNLNLKIVPTTLLGSLLLLVAMSAHQSRARMVLVHGVHGHALQHHKRASSRSSGSSSDSGPHGPAWHEHPMWNHPALHEGAKLWPSPSSSSKSSSKASPKPSSTHSPAHSVESTGAKPSEHATATSHLNKGKGLASGSGAAKDGSRAAETHGKSSAHKVEIYSFDKGGSFKDSMQSGSGRPVGRKDTKPRKTYNLDRKKQKKG